MKRCPKCGETREDSESFCPKCGEKLSQICTACGKPLSPGVKFCTGCGAPVGPAEPEGASAPGPQAGPTAKTAARTPEARPAGGGAPSKRKIPAAVLVLIPVLILAVGVAAFFGIRWYARQAQAKDLLENGSQLLESGEYRKAESELEELVELQPENAQGVMALARAYLHQEKFKDAARCLRSLPLEADDSGYDAYQSLLAAAQLEPKLTAVNTDHFPQVDVIFRCGGDVQIPREGIQVAEDGKAYPLSDCQWSGGTLTASYIAPDSQASDELRQISVALKLDEFTFQREESYYTPHFEPAQVRLVSADVSRYPQVTVYLQVEDPLTGEPVEGLDTKAFRISERLQGGEYLSREVHSAATLEGNRGLSIDLVADKSSSISFTDMEKIKMVMTGFVNSLHYQEGDRAEVLAFDSIVQQMCYYTNDSTLLVNGINNMSTDGLTALYDAIHDGVHNAALQGGARCVIAFTDGMDNESRYTPGEIVQYALTNQVPVYIIGVGYDVEESTLRAVAEDTGGEYWFIDDLYDLQAIFDEIYAEQKKLYAVEYTSDTGADAYAARELEVTVSGAGRRAQEQVSFQAVPSVSGKTHASRYELVREALTWEEAAQRCQEMGGHLATITSQDEMDAIVSMAEGADLRYIWLGGYTSYDGAGNVFAHWVTGEPVSFQLWSDGEPSRRDLDGVDEWYIMLWNIPSLGGWRWNDQRNDPVSAVPSMAKSMGFICEYES